MCSLISILLIIYMFPTGCASFEKRCPYPWEWKIRERVFCTYTFAKSYYCLYDDNNKQFIELCRADPNTAARGYEIAYSGGFELKKCADTRYQPFGFVTEGASVCVFLKMLCHDEGLRSVEYGEPTTDQKCACDYTQGYNFVVMPVDKCHCIPSQEDCSCYKQLCNESSILTPDYTCANSNEFHYRQMCSGFRRRSAGQTKITTSISVVFDDKKFQFNQITAIAVLVMIITIGLEMIVFISIHLCEPAFKIERPVYLTAEGHDVELLTIVDSCLPVALIAWKKTCRNGEIINLNNNSSKNTRILGHKALHLKNVNREDSGIYTCHVSTIYGEFDFFADVIVEDMPVLQTIVLFDNTMRITCSVPSPEKPFTIHQVSWKKKADTLNCAAIASDSKYEMNHKYPSLLIRNLNEDDVGTYICKISSNSGEDMACTIAIGTSDIVLHTNDSVDNTMLIKCSVPSTEKEFPIQKVVWKKIAEMRKSFEISSDSKYQLQHDPPSLLIRKIDVHDVGKYICCTSCKNEERICSIVIASPKITCEVSQLCALPGKDITLKYFITSDFPVGTNLQKANKEKKVDNLSKDVTYNSVSHTIKSANFDDAGTYSCIVSNALGTNTASRIVIIGDRPEIKTECLSYINPERHDITIKCEVTSTLPLLNLSWEKNLVKIDPNNQIGKYKNGSIEVPSLTINCVTQSDQGKYICYASNVAGNAESSVIDVTIAGIPLIKTDCQTYDVCAGVEITLQCNVTSILPITNLFWTRNGKRIENKNKFKEASVEFPSLIITKTEMSDQGSYVCCACNEAGMSNSDPIELNIKQDTDLHKSWPEIYYTGKKIRTGTSVHDPYYKGTHKHTGTDLNKSLHESCIKENEEHSARKIAQVALNKFDAAVARERSRHVIDEELRIVVIGKTGAGKSATCNTISGEDIFKSDFCPIGVTKTTESRRVVVCEKNILLIDTPGIFDSETDENELEQEIGRCVLLGAPGIHAILFVMPLNQRTDENIKVINTFLQYFGHELKQHVIVVFTFGDMLAKKKKNIKDYLKNAPADILDFLKQCGNRHVVFNNELESYERTLQVQGLVDLISRHKYEKVLGYYTDKIFESAEKNLIEKEDEIQKTLESLYQNQVDEFNVALKTMSESVMKCLQEGVEGDKEKYQKQIRELQTRNTEQIEELRTKYEERLSRVRDEARSALKDKHTYFTFRRKSISYDRKDEET